jgi:hypothetical protein
VIARVQCTNRGLQLADAMRNTREGLQTGTHKAAVPRGHIEETDGGQGGGRCRKQAAAEAAAVTQSGGGSAGASHIKRGGGSTGGRYRNKAAQQAAVAQSGEAAQQAAVAEKCSSAGGLYRKRTAVTGSARPSQAAVARTMPWGRMLQQPRFKFERGLALNL